LIDRTISALYAVCFGYPFDVSAVKAHVKNGRLVVDEPTSLPEGAEVKLWIVEGDDLGDEERAKLHDAIREGVEDAKAGRTVDADEFLRDLRSRP
jgi:hypothetical protein